MFILYIHLVQCSAVYVMLSKHRRVETCFACNILNCFCGPRVHRRRRWWADPGPCCSYQARVTLRPPSCSHMMLQQKRRHYVNQARHHAGTKRWLEEPVRWLEELEESVRVSASAIQLDSLMKRHVTLP